MKSNDSIARSYSLSACATGTATLSFDWRQNEDLSGTLSVEVGNGTTWTTTHVVLRQRDNVVCDVHDHPSRSRQQFSPASQIRFSHQRQLRQRVLLRQRADRGIVRGCCPEHAGERAADPGRPANPELRAECRRDRHGDVPGHRRRDHARRSATPRPPVRARSPRSRATRSRTTSNSPRSPRAQRRRSGSNVLQGSTITYNVDVKNIGGTPLTDLQIADTLPAGVTYVPNSAKISGARTFVQYLDQFTAQSYTNTDGITNWATTPGSRSATATAPTGGNIEITNDNDQPGTRNVLYVKGKRRALDPPPDEPLPCATGTADAELRLATQATTSPAARCTSMYRQRNQLGRNKPCSRVRQHDVYATYSQRDPGHSSESRRHNSASGLPTTTTNCSTSTTSRSRECAT